MGKEIERKFLVKSDDYVHLARGVLYLQGYISLEANRIVRVRAAGDHAFITLKGKNVGIERQEFEYEIPVEDAREMLEQLCIKPLIEKHRYKIPFEDHTWEVDVFHKENDGLVVAEIELQSADETFQKPAWIGEEVTADGRYSNANLVRHPYEKW